MCKFTHRLFVFSALQLIVRPMWTAAAPAVDHKAQDHQRLLEELFEKNYDYDLHYDQRQKGDENLRIKLDGFFIGMPAQDTSGFLLLTDDILDTVGDELLMGLAKKHISSAPDKSTPAPDNPWSIQMNKEALPLAPPATDLETIILEIPAAKKDFEARQQAGSELQEDEQGVASISRTKGRIFQLLNFLRGNKKT